MDTMALEYTLAHPRLLFSGHHTIAEGLQVDPVKPEMLFKESQIFLQLLFRCLAGTVSYKIGAECEIAIICHTFRSFHNLMDKQVYDLYCLLYELYHMKSMLSIRCLP